MTAILYVALAITSIGLIWGLDSFNRLVDLEFTQFHDRWVADGKPNGGRTSRAQASFWRSGFARNRLIGAWLLETPEWTRGNPAAASLLRCYRIGATILSIGVFFFIAVALLGT
jgi:hypothetical protein